MSQVVRIDRTGGPDVLSCQVVPCGEPQTGEIAIRHTAIGVNYIDIYHRTGVYPLPLPATLGVEGAGVVTAVGAGVEGFAVGDRVAYAGGAPGAYSTERLLSAARAVQLPEGVSGEQAAAAVVTATAEPL